MSVLIFVESHEGKLKKAALELVTYGKKIADVSQTACRAIVLGQAEQPGILGRYGASLVYHLDDEKLSHFDSQTYSAVLEQAIQATNASVVVLPHNSTGKSLLGRLAARLHAASAPGVNSLPDLSNGFTVKKPVFSGKATATLQLHTDIKLLSLAPNSFPPEEIGQDAPIESLSVDIPAPRVKVLSVSKVEGNVPLPEAERVVSGGRGFKGPENWGILEDLAQTLDATTACSRPVADADWRPHHEHVGQTGIAIRPNLYIAIGISGAIQHLAGVNNSKVIVVINKDAEAPFFKAADYGVVGDLFEVVPKFTEALKKFKASNS